MILLTSKASQIRQMAIGRLISRKRDINMLLFAFDKKFRDTKHTQIKGENGRSMTVPAYFR